MGLFVGEKYREREAGSCCVVWQWCVEGNVQMPRSDEAAAVNAGFEPTPCWLWIDNAVHSLVEAYYTPTETETETETD